MANAGLMGAEADGKFHPNQLATRADIAKIIYNFADKDKIFDSFKDVEGHWAKIYILVAAGNGWITGYPDGTFRPDGNVTRAEAVAIINRVLDRVPADQTRLFFNMNHYSDVTANDWFYLPVQEATTSHTYERTSYLKNFADENWLERIPNINWTLVEMDMRLRMLQF